MTWERYKTPTKREFLEMDVKEAYGIGQVTAKELKKNGIKTVGDLLMTDFKTLMYITGTTKERAINVIKKNNNFLRKLKE